MQKKSFKYLGLPFKELRHHPASTPLCGFCAYYLAERIFWFPIRNSILGPDGKFGARRVCCFGIGLARYPPGTGA